MSDQATYFSLIEKVGSKGRYQTIIFLIIALNNIVIGAIMLGPSILFLSSDPDCSNVKLQNGQTCIQYICTLDQSQWPKFYPNKVDSLRYSFNNFFICGKQWIISLLQSCVYFGNLVANIVFSNISDNYGRKFMYIMGWMIACSGMLLLSCSWNQVSVGIGLFLIGLGMDPSLTVGYVILYQQIDYNRFQYFAIYTQVGFTLGGLIQGQLFYLIGSWRFFIIYSFLIPSLLILCLINFIQETPRFTCKKGVLTALKSLGRIAKINGLQQNPIKQQDITLLLQKTDKINELRNNKKMSVKDLFFYKSLRMKTICLTLQTITLIIFFYGPFYIIDSIGYNQYVNQFVLNLADFLVYPLALVTINKVPRKKLGITSGIIFGILNTFAIFLVKPLAEIILISIARFAICYWFTIYVIYSNQCTPSIVRGVRNSFTNVLSRLCIFSMPALFQILSRNRSFPLIFFALVSVVSVIVMFPLPQTLNAKISQQIEQLAEGYKNDSNTEKLINKEEQISE